MRAWVIHPSWGRIGPTRTQHQYVMAAKNIPIDVTVRNGNTLILNTRSSQALIRAGIARRLWTVVDRPGQLAYEERLSKQLSKNGLSDTGTDLH